MTTKRIIRNIKLWYNLKFKCTEEDRENTRLRILADKYNYKGIDPEEVINGGRKVSTIITFLFFSHITQFE